MIEQGNPLFAVIWVTSNYQPKHVSLMTARTSMWKMKQQMIERGNPLFAPMQITSNQCWTRWALTSECLDCHILMWNKLRTLVFVNWSRRSRTTLTDSLFNDIYNKTKPTTRSVRSQKQMIQDMGKVELFELFETDPKTQCRKCLSYWSEGIVYCTCGHLLKESAANRGVIQCTLDFLSFPNCVIKKDDLHGHRYGRNYSTKRSLNCP